MKSTYNPNTVRGAGAVVISAVMLIGIYTLILSDPSQPELSEIQPTNSAIPSPSNIQNSTPSPSEIPIQSTITDGTYSTSRTYSVPKGDSNSIQISVTIRTGIVSDLQFDSNASDPESRRYIDSFKSQIQGAIVGKDIEQVDLYRVGGASLTTQAFEGALSEIIDSAKS